MHRKLGPMYGPVNAFQHKTQQLFCDYFLTHAFETFNVKRTNSSEERRQLRLDLDFCRTF